MRRTLFLVVLMLAACDDGKSDAPPAKQERPAASAEQTAADAKVEAPTPETPTADAPPAEAVEPAPVPPAAASLDPQLAAAPPPEGVLLPKVGKVREVEPGARNTAYSWKAIFEVDPSDPQVAALVVTGEAKDAGDAGALLYRKQLQAATIELSMYGPESTYMIDGGASVVSVLSTDQFHPDDPTGFSLSVGPAGG